MPHTYRPYTTVTEGTEDLMVSDLLDGEEHEWNQLVVEELFSREGAEMILKIPISFRDPDDRLV